MEQLAKKASENKAKKVFKKSVDFKKTVCYINEATCKKSCENSLIKKCQKKIKKVVDIKKKKCYISDTL